MGLRDYISHLDSLGMINSPPTAADFLTAYEYARFSFQALSQGGFRELMRLFAELLRSMQALNSSIIASLDIDISQDQIHSDASSLSSAWAQSSSPSISSAHSDSGSGGYSIGTIRTAPSRRVTTNGTTTDRHSAFSTAPATPGSRRPNLLASSRSPSINNFAQSRRPYNGSGSSSAEFSSGSSSVRSMSQSSVIHLRRPSEDGELPFVLTPPVR